MTQRILPFDQDPDTGSFFAAAQERRLVYRRCKVCGRGNHVPMTSCRFCASTDTEWHEAAGTGTLYSWTVVTHQVHPAYPTPYTVAVVALDDAPDVRLIGHLAGTPELAPDAAMRVAFEDWGEGFLMPNWQQAEQEIAE